LQFHWDEINRQEIAAHGVDEAVAEAVFFAEDRGIIKDPRSHNRFIAEGTVDSKLYRVPFSNAYPDGIRITTAFRISRKRRRT
jgi:uncharacterized DUF497 family protein